MQPDQHTTGPSFIGVYTDGSRDGGTGLGGWAACITNPDGERRVLMGASPKTKSHIMEIVAATAALKRIPPAPQVVVFTDCESLCRVGESRHPKYTLRKGGSAVRRLFDAIGMHGTVRFEKVRAHDGVIGNEQVDGLAKQAVRQLAQKWKLPLRESFGLLRPGETLPHPWPHAV